MSQNVSTKKKHNTSFMVAGRSSNVFKCYYYFIKKLIIITITIMCAKQLNGILMELNKNVNRTHSVSWGGRAHYLTLVNALL